MSASLEAAFAPALVWTCGTLALGYAVGALLGLAAGDRLALAIEYANRNLALATVVAISSFQRPDFMGFPTAVMMMAFPASLAAGALHRRSRGPNS